MRRTPSPHCELCLREGPLTFHHLIPRTLHSNKWFKKNFSREEMQKGIDLCRDCHSAIHEFIPEKEMGRGFNTREKLMAHAEVAEFVGWIAGRTTDRVRTRKHRG